VRRIGRRSPRTFRAKHRLSACTDTKRF
jgi:hypothetical protein